MRCMVYNISCREAREGASVGLSSNALCLTKGLELATQFDMQIELPSTLHLLTPCLDPVQ